jgi:hypothetical protein
VVEYSHGRPGRTANGAADGPLSPRDLRALQAIADDMERPLAWVARRGIRLYISQLLDAEATLAGGDHIVEGDAARGPRAPQGGGARGRTMIR